MDATNQIPANEIQSVGHVAGQLQITPQRILSIAAQLGIDVALRINGVAHFAESDVELLTDHVRLSEKKTDAD